MRTIASLERQAMEIAKIVQQIATFDDDLQRKHERQLLGYLMYMPAALTDVLDILHPADLRDPLHRRLYELILQAYEAGDDITPTSLVTALGADKSTSLMVMDVMAHADIQVDVVDVAMQIQAIVERRLVSSDEPLEPDVQ